jgi:predicted small lipoprotein YifL
MKNRIVAFLILLALAGLAAGCGKKPADANQVFNAAPPEIQTAWTQAAAADKAGDYVTAVTGYRNLALMGDKLTHEQVVTVNLALVGVNQRLYQAYMAGDAAAGAAYAKLFPK